MQCSAEEIERKRQEAIKRRENKKDSPIKVQEQPPQSFYNQGLSTKNNSPKFNYQKSFTNKYKPVDKTPISEFINSTNSKVIQAKCVLLTETRFSIELSGYSTPAIEMFKKIPSKNFDIKTKTWSFNIKDYEQIFRELSLVKDHFAIIPFPSFVLKSLTTPKRDLSTIDLSRIEPELRNALMPFQKEGVAFGIDKNGRCLIADDMGLGKTFQALAIASYYRDNWPLLIVTTSSMKNTWEETILQYLPSIPAMEIQYLISGKDSIINNIKVLIVSHDMLTRTIDKLIQKKFGVLILDESHTFKNYKTKATQAACKMCQYAKRVILLSGTPALSRTSELYTQLALIDKKFFGNFMEYSKRYCDGKQTNFGWNSSGQSNLQELEIILARKFMIRRTKDQVLSAIPKKNQEIVTLDVKLNQLSDTDRKYLKSLSQQYQNEKGNEKQAILLTFFSETARIKIPSVISYILQILEVEKKFLVFAHHQIMLDAIEEILKKKNKKFIRIDGNTLAERRKHCIDRFQKRDDCICALLSITAANAGITLTAANLVIFAELHWNPSILSQAESRAHRIGQNKQVIIRYLLANGTADDSIWPILQEKQKTLKELGLCKENFNEFEIKHQDIATNDNLTDGLPSNKSFKRMDITNYLESPNKKQKLNDSVVSDLNESLFNDSFNITQQLNANDEGNKELNVEEMFNDGLDDILSKIDV